MLSSVFTVAAVFSSLVATGASAPVGPAASSPSEQAQSPYAAVAAAATPAIVNIKFVMHYDAGGGDQSEESEVHGVIIDPAGIVLISSASMFGYEGMGVQVRPQDIKILVGDDTAGLDAEVLMRDRERDLAWLRITDEVAEPLASINFAEGAKATLGQTMLQVWKLDKFFDLAPYVSAGKVASIVSKPRDLFIASGEISMGLPVFDESGRPLGFGVLQLPTEEELSAMGGSNMYTNMIFARTILPASAVHEATKQALAALDDGEDD